MIGENWVEDSKSTTFQEGGAQSGRIRHPTGQEKYHGRAKEVRTCKLSLSDYGKILQRGLQGCEERYGDCLPVRASWLRLITAPALCRK